MLQERGQESISSERPKTVILERLVLLYPLGLCRTFGKITFAFPRMAHLKRSAHIMEDTIDHGIKCGTK
jgi:hypothetical protein